MKYCLSCNFALVVTLCVPCIVPLSLSDLLVGLVVKASASRVKDPGFDSRGEFSGFSHTGDLKTGTPVTTLPNAWRYRVSAWTSWPGVSIL